MNEELGIKSQFKRWTINVLLLLSSTVISFIIAEIIFALLEQRICKLFLPMPLDIFPNPNFDNTIQIQGVKNAWLPDGGSLLHIRSKNPNLMYELRPNAQVGELIRINSAGFRDYEFQKQKTNGVFRIAVLGNSITFGWGLALEDTYPKILENLLNEKKGNKKFTYQVYNFAIDGYNSLPRSRIIGTNSSGISAGFNNYRVLHK